MRKVELIDVPYKMDERNGVCAADVFWLRHLLVHGDELYGLQIGVLLEEPQLALVKVYQHVRQRDQVVSSARSTLEDAVF